MFYIISDGDSKSKKYKVGIDGEDINVRLAQHRSTTPKILLEYLLYTDKYAFIETSMLQKFSEYRDHLNHEWIYNVDSSTIINSVKTLVNFLCIQATEEIDLDTYNKEIMET